MPRSKQREDGVWGNHERYVEAFNQLIKSLKPGSFVDVTSRTQANNLRSTAKRLGFKITARRISPGIFRVWRLKEGLEVPKIKRFEDE